MPETPQQLADKVAETARQYPADSPEFREVVADVNQSDPATRAAVWTNLRSR